MIPYPVVVVLTTLCTTAMALEVAPVKARALALCAGCDRGFGASTRDRELVEAALDDLAAFFEPGSTEGFPDCRLKKNWRLVYTSAPDVSPLNSNPFAQVNAIFQDATELPVIVNIIDATPRVPFQLDATSRLQVFTRATVQGPDRVGLTFERVELRPYLLPPLALDLPRASSYFDVRYLDDDFLLIQQAQPGGVFAAVAS